MLWTVKNLRASRPVPGLHFPSFLKRTKITRYRVTAKINAFKMISIMTGLPQCLLTRKMAPAQRHSRFQIAEIISQRQKLYKHLRATEIRTRNGFPDGRAMAGICRQRKQKNKPARLCRCVSLKWFSGEEDYEARRRGEGRHGKILGRG